MCAEPGTGWLGVSRLGAFRVTPLRSGGSLYSALTYPPLRPLIDMCVASSPSCDRWFWFMPRRLGSRPPRWRIGLPLLAVSILLRVRSSSHHLSMCRWSWVISRVSRVVPRVEVLRVVVQAEAAGGVAARDPLSVGSARSQGTQSGSVSRKTD